MMQEMAQLATWSMSSIDRQLRRRTIEKQQHQQQQFQQKENEQTQKQHHTCKEFSMI